jgi:serine protease AprX
MSKSRDKAASMERPAGAEMKSRMPTGAMGETGKKNEMPTGKMGVVGPQGSMPSGSMSETGGKSVAQTPAPAKKGESQRVIVEMRVPMGTAIVSALSMASEVSVPGFQIDTSYNPIPLTPSSSADAATAREVTAGQVVIIRGTIVSDKFAELEAQPNVVKVWKDTPIAHFSVETLERAMEQKKMVKERVSTALGDCPIPPCDCDPRTPKGAIADVASYLGVDQIWAAGYRGSGIVVGIVDGGITAQGRVTGGTIPNVIGGWPSDWGTVANWGGHGNMTSTDALGMAPDSRIYDIRISDGDAISNAISGFDWAIAQHRTDGTPQILSNSWGIFQETWDAVYARDPNHPFTRKVVEALNEGILVLFAAGNCGEACPDGRCGPDIGPGRSIWGANGHPLVITVGAVNKEELFVGYSSQGPAALDPNKPDFCSITHFTGFFNSDSGTSAATPIAAGVVALLKHVNPALTQDEVKAALKGTAKDIGPTGFDQHSGAGIIRAKAAFDRVAAGRLEVFARGTDHALWHIWQVALNSGWSNWDSLGGWIDAPAVTRNSDGRLEALVIGADHALWHNWQTAPNNGWSGWASLGGVIDMVAVGQNADGRLEVFARGTDGALWHIWQTVPSGGWSDWASLGGVIDLIAVGRNADGRLEVFARGMDGALWHIWQLAPNGSWSDWHSLGGTIDQLAIGQNADGRLEVFARGVDRALWHIWQVAPSNGWSAWDSLGGWIDVPNVTRNADGRLEVFVIGADHGLWHKWQTSPNSGWSDWGSRGGWIDTLAVGQNADGRLEAFARGMDGAMWHIWQTAPNNGWSDWASLGGIIDQLSVGQNVG